jgi:hypothetical protein
MSSFSHCFLTLRDTAFDLLRGILKQRMKWETSVETLLKARSKYGLLLKVPHIARVEVNRVNHTATWRLLRSCNCKGHTRKQEHYSTGRAYSLVR